MNTAANSARFQPPAMTEDFSKLRENGSYYVDKTPFIKTVMKDGNDVTLLTRPRRFGKTMTLSTLKYFLAIDPEHPGDHSLQDRLFKDTAILADHDFCNDNMGQFPVISVSLKDVSASTFEAAYVKLADTINELCKKFRYLLDSDKLLDGEKTRLKFLMDPALEEYSAANSAKLQNALLFLSSCLYEHFNKKTVVLIDEYDVPLESASANGYYETMVEVIRGLLSAVLKTNGTLKKAVLTGCLQVAKESIFTGLNNFTANSVLSTDESLSGSIGFTKDEVLSMLNYFGLSSHAEEYRKWYDGYRFGQSEIFCPWDIISNVRNSIKSKTDKFTPQNSWINSSSNGVIKNYLGLLPPESFGQMLTLVDGGHIELQLNESMNYEDLKQHKLIDFWSLLVHTGYLTVLGKDPQDQIFKLAIPNLEILQCFKRRIVEFFSQEEHLKNSSRNIADMVIKGDCSSLQTALNDLLQHFVSVRDLAVKGKHEYYYHAFLNGVFSNAASLINEYRTNSEAGDGYADICFKSSDGTTGVIIEIKHVLKTEDLQHSAEAGLKQIIDKRYDLPLKDQCRRIIAYGMAFCRKECRLVIQDLTK